MDGFDGTFAGHKGISYDWRAVLRASEFSLDDELDGWATDEAIAQLIEGTVAR